MGIAPLLQGITRGGYGGLGMELRTQLLIVGGGLGGCAAALAASSLGIRTILTEASDWLGGQLTTQAVPPDEHRWIEEQGCTRRYRAFREAIRAYYRRYYPLTETARADPFLNPGGGWVSRLCHEPKVALAVLNAMLAYPQTAGTLKVLHHLHPIDVEVDEEEGDFIWGVCFADFSPDARVGAEVFIEADYILDATETGELLPLAGVEYVTGAESQRETGEPHAKPEAEPRNMQACTWCFAMAYDPNGNYTIRKPRHYEHWRRFQPPFWPGPLLSWVDVDPITLEPRRMSLFGEDGTPSLFAYRQIVNPALYPPELAPLPVTIVNWAQNDYFGGNLFEVPDDEARRHEQEALELSKCLLYWLQTEAPRPDGGTGYPGLHLRPDIVGTEDGFAKMPYIRESRRIRARFTVCEQHVSAACRPGATLAEPFADSVGVGHYRIDLHPSTGGDTYLDIEALPFQIPLGALIPIRMRNLLPACKNIGTTHITNGCYRVHPVEWNIGESAGLLAAFCLLRKVEPHQVYETPALLSEYQALLRSQGIQLEWQL
jgi:hypothetical protein